MTYFPPLLSDNKNINRNSSGSISSAIEQQQERQQQLLEQTFSPTSLGNLFGVGADASNTRPWEHASFTPTRIRPPFFLSCLTATGNANANANANEITAEELRRDRLAQSERRGRLLSILDEALEEIERDFDSDFGVDVDEEGDDDE